MSERTPWVADLDEREGARLLHYAKVKDMSTSAVLRQALRVYDLMEQVPGAYEAVRALQPELHEGRCADPTPAGRES